MQKILVSTSSFNLDNIKGSSRLKAACIDIILNPYSRKLTENEVGNLLQDDVVGMIAGVEPLTSRVLQAAPKLKVISR
jgi:D-3-phosphoglycerate dehydrogenase